MALGWHETLSGGAAKRRFASTVVLVFGIGAALAGGAGAAHADGPEGQGTSSSSESRPNAGSPSGPRSATSAPGIRRHEASGDDTGGAVRRSAPRTARTAPLTAGRPEPRTSATTETRPAPQPAAVSAQPQSTAESAAPESAAPPAAAPTADESLPQPSEPSPNDDAATPYGDIGKWMLTWGDRIANGGGKKYQGRTLLEAVNVIIVDPNSSSPADAGNRLNQAMYRSGFGAQPLHSFGFRGRIDDVTYGQRPKGWFLSYSNDFFLRPNDHGRVFGPDPVQTDTGFVWSAAFSTEKLGFTGWIPGHVYVSSNRARDALATALVNSGQATFGGFVELDNMYNTATTTTGDHDGFAVVLVLTGIGGPPRREMLVSLPGEVSSGLTSAANRTCTALPATISSTTIPAQCSAVEEVVARRP